MSAINEWDIGGVQEPHTDEYSDVDIRNDNVKKGRTKQRMDCHSLYKWS